MLGDISIRKSLEGNAQIQCRSFTSKMLHGDRISLDTTGNIVAEAIYSAACTVESTSGIEVGLMSGTLQVFYICVVPDNSLHLFIPGLQF